MMAEKPNKPLERFAKAVERCHRQFKGLKGDYLKESLFVMLVSAMMGRMGK